MPARLILILALLLGPCANAQISLTGAGAGGSVISGGTTYIGPGDVVSGATAWYGLRGYNAAFATGSNAAINVRRASDNTTSDIDILTNGKLDVATFNTFVGSDGTASCTLAGTTGACTGASGTVHVNDTVTGTGLTQPCIVATASNTAPTIEIAGTTTSCGTVGVAETFTFQVAGFATEAYDQSGNTNHVTQATAGSQPQLLPKCLNSGALPCLFFNRAAGSQYLSGSTTSTTTTATASLVINRVGATNQYSCGLGNLGNTAFAGFTNSANTALIFAGTLGITATANDNAAHAIQYLFAGGSSFINVDGAAGSSGSPGAGSWAGSNITLGTASTDYLQGYIGEAGLWSVNFSSGQNTSMHSNQSAYWGTP